MDIIDPFSPGKEQCKYLFVIIDYFTKWIKVEPLAYITTKKVQSFVCKSIICRFKLLHTVITDNGRQFIYQTLQEFCEGLDIRSITSSIEHLQTNRQVEAANKVILY